MAELNLSPWGLFYSAWSVVRPYWPYIAAGLLVVIGLAAAYLLVTFVAALIRRRVLARQFRAQTPPGTEAAAAPAAPEPERFAVLPDGVSTVSLERSFAEVLALLKRHVPNRQFRYQIPWFLSIGDEGAGKTALFASAPIHRPFADPGIVPQPGAACSWWFFDTAIVLDLAGRAVLAPGGRTPEGTLWRRFIKLLQASRPQRPLDGLILTISARDLLDQSAEGSNTLLLKAESLHNRIWELQKALEINVPIHVIVTQCDALDGFPEFCAALPPEIAASMLGWSSPYGVETSFNPRWVAEIVDETLADITAIETDLYVSRPLADERGRLALLPDSFLGLRRPLEQFLGRIFTPTAYHEVFVLRGVYFTGAGAPAAPVTGAYGAAPITGAYGATPVNGAYGAMGQPGAPAIAFVRDTLEQKIFQELGLARPVSRALFVSTKRARLAQATLAATATVLTGAVIYESGALADRTRVIGATVEETRRDLIRFEERARMGGLGADPVADPPTVGRLLSAAVLVEREDLATPLLPTSLLSGIDGELETLVSVALQRMVLKSLRGGLLQQLNTAVADLGQGAGGGARSANVSMDSRAAPRSIEQLPGYQRLSRYIDHLAALRENLDRYERLRRTGSFADLGSLTHYVFGVAPPPILKDNERFRSEAIRRARLQDINVDPLQAAAGVGALQFAEDLYDDLFARNSLAFWTRRLQAQLETLRANAVSNRVAAKDLQDIQASFRQLSSVADASVNRWILTPEMRTPLEIDSLLGRIAVSVLLSGRTFEDVSRTLDTRAAALRDEMLAMEMPFVGRVFVQNQAGAPYQLNERFADLFDPMEVLLSQGFMTDLGVAGFERLGPGDRLHWDISVLNQAKQYKIDYSTYVAQRLADFPKPLHAALRIAVGRRMVDNVLTLSARAVSVSGAEESPRATAATDRSLADQVASFLTVAPIVQELVDGVRPIAEPGSTLDLEHLLNAQSVQILNRVSDILAAEEPYRALTENVARWDGEPGAFTRAFGAANGGELSALMAAARQRIRVLARSYAKPALDYIKDPYRIGAPGADRTVQEWQDILAALDRHDQQIPNNALSDLEKFVLYVGNAVGRDDCREVLGERAGLVSGGDYFSRVHVRALAGLTDRCRRFQAQQTQTVMSELGGSFTQLLAGRFPFVHPSEARSAPDADPADIRRFYQLYDELKPRLEQELATVRGRATPLKGFIDQIEAARGFLADIVDPEGSGSLRLSAELTFGVNRVNEVGGDQIIDWSVRAGKSAASSGSPDRTLVWSYAEPVELRFRWASGSDHRPRRDESRAGAPMVTDDTAIFVEKGPWSLLRLLVERGVRNPESFEPALRGQQVVRITIPTRSLSGMPPRDAVVFIAARVTAGADGKAPRKGVPEFPTRFPDVRVAGF